MCLIYSSRYIHELFSQTVRRHETSYNQGQTGSGVRHTVTAVESSRDLIIVLWLYYLVCTFLEQSLGSTQQHYVSNRVTTNPGTWFPSTTGHTRQTQGYVTEPLSLDHRSHPVE